MEITPELEDTLTKIFMPHAHEQKDRVSRENKRFVHYTSAEAAKHILINKQIWLRNASAMNDFMEVQHGFQCLKKAWDGEVGSEFKAALNNISPSLSDDLVKRFDSWFHYIKFETYLLCVSEHEANEDKHGRLSMWRGYGATSSVAFVMNTPVFFGRASLAAISSPVAYLSDSDFEKQFKILVEKIKEGTPFLKSIDRNLVLSSAFQSLRLASVCTKHPGFSEEKEWRVIYCPKLSASPYIEQAYESLHGAPQIIHKIPLKAIPEANYQGAEIAALIDRIIIGPSQYPMVLYQAFVELLTNAGVADAATKVITSDIPIRT